MDSNADRGRPSYPSPRRLHFAAAPARKSPENRGGAAPAGGRSTLREQRTLANIVALRGDRIFREDLLDPLDRLLGCGLGSHAALHDIGPPDAPHMLLPELSIS